MPLEHVKVKVVGTQFEQPVVERQCPVEVAYCSGRVSANKLKGGVVRLLFQKHIRLLKGLLETLAFIQYLRIVITRGAKIRRELQTALQQKISIIQNIQLSTDFGQQPHPLNLLGIFLHKGPAKFFGQVKLALIDHARD